MTKKPPSEEELMDAVRRSRAAAVSSDLRLEFIERLVATSESLKSQHAQVLIDRLKRERARSLQLEQEIEFLKVEARIRQRVYSLMQKAAAEKGEAPMQQLQAEALVTYHGEAWDEGRGAGQRALLAELEGCIVCRCVASDTDILNGVQTIIDAHKEMLGVD